MTALLPREDHAPALRPAPTIRLAGPGDASALSGLARLDSSFPPRGHVLLAEVGGELWAALSLDDGHVVADPFRRTAEVVQHLAEHGRAMRPRRRGLRRLRPLSA